MTYDVMFGYYADLIKGVPTKYSPYMRQECIGLKNTHRNCYENDYKKLTDNLFPRLWEKNILWMHRIIKTDKTRMLQEVSINPKTIHAK